MPRKQKNKSRQSPGASQHSNYLLKVFLPIPPEKQLRADSERIECPERAERFVPQRVSHV
jgi:hypothetical protein